MRDYIFLEDILDNYGFIKSLGFIFLLFNKCDQNFTKQLYINLLSL